MANIFGFNILIIVSGIQKVSGVSSGKCPEFRAESFRSFERKVSGVSSGLRGKLSHSDKFFQGEMDGDDDMVGQPMDKFLANAFGGSRP